MATATKTVPKRTKVLGLDLTREEVQQLENGKVVSLKNRSLNEMGGFLQELDKRLVAVGKGLTWGELLSYSGSGRCPGIKLISFDENCGLYFHPFKGLDKCCKE
jgi:hypothetical protein